MNEILGGVDLPLSQASQSRAGKGKKRAAVADLDDGAADDMPDARSVSGLKRTTSASSASGVTTAGDGSLGRARHGVASFSRSSSFTSRQPTLHRALSANSLHPDLLQPHVPSPIPEENEPRSSGGSSAQAKAADMPYSGKRFLIRCGKGRTQRAVVSAVLALGGQVLGDDAQTWGDGADYVVVKMRRCGRDSLPSLSSRRRLTPGHHPAAADPSRSRSSPTGRRRPSSRSTGSSAATAERSCSPSTPASSTARSTSTCRSRARAASACARPSSTLTSRSSAAC